MSVVLGLGTNSGDRLHNLRQALAALRLLKLDIEAISPIYISDALLPENAPKQWNQAYFNIALRCKTRLTPEALLNAVQMIEQQLGRPKEHAFWGPRLIDIDLLAWDEHSQQTEHLTLPHPELLNRPFALWPLADVMPFWVHPKKDKTAAELVEAWGSRFSGEAPFHTRQLAQRLTGAKLVGILNITPDSFTDGGKYFDPASALQQAHQLIEDGAEIIDIGAESASPRATPISWQEEWQRLEPVLTLMQTEKRKFIIPPKISIDTRHAETATRALTYGVDWINDIGGFDQPAMCQALLNSPARIVVMHHVNIPEQRDRLLARDQDPVLLTLDWGRKRIAELVEKGFTAEQIIFDPGIGFGKMPEQSLEILRRMKEFTSLKVELFVGHSRKTFFPYLKGKPLVERDLETALTSLFLSTQGVAYLRIHNVAMHARVLKAATELIT